jgi:hypothetical protein
MTAEITRLCSIPPLQSGGESVGLYFYTSAPTSGTHYSAAWRALLVGLISRLVAGRNHASHGWSRSTRIVHICQNMSRAGRGPGRLFAVDGETPTTGAGTPADLPVGPGLPDVGPLQPSAEVRTELRALLAADESRLGQVYRCLEEGLDADAIASKFEVGYSSNFGWNYRRLIRALIDADLPTAPTVALAAARRFRSILKDTNLSAATRGYLEASLDELDRRANDTDRREEEAHRAQVQTQEAEARDEVGIYVYALPHYLRYPFEPDTGRTLLKVGRSDSDVIVRFRNQTRTTALPEEPICCGSMARLVARPHR